MFQQAFPYPQMVYYYPIQPYMPYMMFPQQIVQPNQCSQPVYSDQQLKNSQSVVKQCQDETNHQEIRDSHEYVIGDPNSSEDDEDFQAVGFKDQSDKSYAVNQLNASTNIQKNYAKAIMLFIKQQNAFIMSVLGEKKAFKFFQLVKKIQNKTRNITHIRKYTKDEEYLKLFRMLINKFINKDYVCYIYNSKIQLKTSHIKGKHLIKKSIIKI